MPRPTISVHLDDATGSGTWPHDVTAFVDLSTGIRIRRGRDDELDDVTTGELNLTFKATDARFTLGHATYGITYDKRVRVRYTVSGVTRTRFIGYVQDWPTKWNGSQATLVLTPVLATDRLARLERRKLKSLVENEVLADSPLGYYTCGEPAGSVSLGDSSGNAQPSLTLEPNASGTFAFGADMGAPRGDFTGLMMAPGASGRTWSGPVVGATGAGTGLRLEALINTTTGNTTIAGLESPDGAYVWLRMNGGQAEVYALEAGGSVVTILSGTSLINDGEIHLISMQTTWGANIRLFVDGVLEDIGTSPAAFAPNHCFVGSAWTGTVAHVFYGEATVNSPRMEQYLAAATTAFEGETAGARMARLAAIAGIPHPAETDFDTGDPQGQHATAGSSVADAAREVATTEGGVVFVAGDGRLTFHDKSHRVLRATGAAQLALTSEDVQADDLVIGGGKAYLRNEVTVSRPGGATQRAVNAASITSFDSYPANLEINATDDAGALARASWEAAEYGTPIPRVSSMTMDLLTQTSTAKVQSAQALELGDRVTVSSMPSTSPLATIDVLVEGWVEFLSTDTWQITFNTVRSDLFRPWILGNATYGVLGTTTIPHF